jgi:Protein of unknown function (DUF4238)
MSADQNHHYLPQKYQRGWADKEGLVRVCRWRHDRILCDRKSTKSTGGSRGLYYTPMAPPEKRNYMEDVFWKKIDQWGSDGLELLRTNEPGAVAKINLERLAVYILSLELRNPRKIAEIEIQAKRHVLEGCLAEEYSKHRRAHEPATFEEFQLALDQPGLTEHGALCLRELVLNRPIRKRLLTMDWQMVTVTNSVPILTSDAPLIRHRGMKHDDGMWILPISTNEFLVIFNRGLVDMVRSIELNIRDGVFVEAMNKYVIQNKIDYVYGVQEEQMDFVKRYWAVSEVAN